jgi:hypothetical protein
MAAGRALGSVPSVAVVPASTPPLRRSPVPKHEPRPASRVLTWHTERPGAHVQGTLALVLPDDTDLDDTDPAPPGTRDRSEPTDGTGDRTEPTEWTEPTDRTGGGPAGAAARGGRTGTARGGSAGAAARTSEVPQTGKAGAAARGAQGGADGTEAPRGQWGTATRADRRGTATRGGQTGTAARGEQAGVTGGRAGTTARDRLNGKSGTPGRSDPDRTGVLPEPRVWAATFAQAAMEVAGGLRSAGQLVRWTTPDVHSILVRRGALTTRARRSGRTTSKPRLRAIKACTPRPGICEVGAVIAEPDRVRAVAFRMEGLHGRWRVTELEIG